MKLKHILSLSIIKILAIYFCLYPALIDSQETTLSEQRTQEFEETPHQSSEAKFGTEAANCNNENLKTSQTYAIPVEQLGKGLFRPILPPEGNLLPPWLNVTLYNEGIRFSNKHFFSVFLFPIAAISIFVSNPLITPLLLATGKSASAEASNRRMVATILHMKTWYEKLLEVEEDKDCNTSDQDQPLNPFVLESLYNIRRVHFTLIRNYPWNNDTANSNRSRKSKFTRTPTFWAAYKADIQGSTIPQKYREWPKYMTNLGELLNDNNLQGPATDRPHYLNQLTLATTQFILGGLHTLTPETGGISASEEEFEAFLHLWAVFGYTLGIEDQFNVALQPNLQKAREYYQELMNTFLYPSLFHLAENEDAQALYEAFLKGFVLTFSKAGGPFSYLNMEQFMLLSIEDVLGIPCPNINAGLSSGHKVLRSVVFRYLIGLVGRFQLVKEYVNGRFKADYCEVGAKTVYGFGANDLEQIVEKGYA